jgi:hypothetical protein
MLVAREKNRAYEEAKQVIDNLLLNGCTPEMLLLLINQRVKMSRLRITSQFRIFLVDYDNMEIKMAPLPKALFLFYLRHPEGVMFSYLQDYKDEIEAIYAKLSHDDDAQKIQENVSRLIDPLNNSVNEKCAIVKKAFVSKLSGNIAANYYISGVQGQKKKIPLDRSLVEWDCA